MIYVFLFAAMFMSCIAGALWVLSNYVAMALCLLIAFCHIQVVISLAHKRRYAH